MTDTITFPQVRTCPYDPAPGYAPLRTGPIHRVTLTDGRPAWVISGHHEARALLADSRVSSDRRHENFPVVGVTAIARVAPRLPMVSLDGPEHTKIRRALISEFTVRRMKELRPRIEKIVHDTLDALLAAEQPADLMARFALPVPSLVICELLGVPYADHDFFENATRRIATKRGTEEGFQAFGELNQYIAKLAADPPPGLLARLKAERVDTGEFDPLDLVIAGQFLLVAGHETTSAMIALGALALLERPELVTAMRAQPDVAVEELLRHLSIIDGPMARVAVEDIEIGGEVIKAGDGVIISTSIANRDPAEFTDPDTLDFGRPANHHIAFGYGVHQCLGQNLARMELRIALPALFERLPNLRLAVPANELRMVDNPIAERVAALPVAW